MSRSVVQASSYGVRLRLTRRRSVIRFGALAPKAMTVAQHFLLSAKARTLSLAAVMRMTDEEAYAAFVAIRWAATGGEPVCPRCDCAAVYAYSARRIWKKACAHQFSVTSGTIFASRKLPIRDYLAAI